VFSRICTGVSRGASRGGSTGVGTTEGRAGQDRAVTEGVTKRVLIGITV